MMTDTDSRVLGLTPLLDQLIPKTKMTLVSISRVEFCSSRIDDSISKKNNFERFKYCVLQIVLVRFQRI